MAIEDSEKILADAAALAKAGADIIDVFANGDIDESVNTDSGPVFSIATLQRDYRKGLQKALNSSRMYPSTAAGLANTVDQEYFFVYSTNNAKEIYRVYKNNGGTAVDQNKVFLSGTDLANALQAAEDYSESANSSYQNTKTLSDQFNVQVSTFNAKFYQYATNLSEYGLVAGGDVGVALQRAHDAGVSKLFINPGKYKWTTQAIITHFMEIYGAGYAESPSAGLGTWFELNQTNFTPLIFNGPDARGSVIGKCAFWETNHPNEVAGWTPAANDWVIKVTDCYGRVVFDDVFMLRVNKGVYCYNSGRMHFKKITGQWYSQGIEIDKCLDVPAIDYIHHWTFYTSSNVVLDYQQKNLDLIKLKRCDGGFLGNVFGFATRSNIRLSGSTDGIPSKIYVNALCSDFTQKTLWLDNTANNSSILIANMTTQGEAWPSTGQGITSGAGAIVIDSKDSEVQVGNFHSQRYYDSTIKVNGTGNRIRIFDAWFELSNQQNNSSPLVYQADTTSDVYFGGPVRIDNSNSAPLFGTGITGRLAASANRSAGSLDEPRLFWGSGASGIQANSPNANSDLYLGSKGQNGSTRIQANGKTIVRFDDGNGTANTAMLVRANANNLQFFAEGGATDVDYIFMPKGKGVNAFNTPVKFPLYNFADLTGALAATYSGCTVRVGDKNQRLATSDGTNWRYSDGSVIS